MSAINSDDIPDDVVLRILDHLQPEDRVRVRRTARRFQKLCDDFAVLKYEEALAAAGLQDGPPLRPEKGFRPPSSWHRDPGSVMGCHTGAPFTYVYFPVESTAKQIACVGNPPIVHVPQLPIPGRQPPLTAEQKRERLAGREERWRTITPAVTTTMRWAGVWNPLWDEFNGGILVKTSGFKSHPQHDMMFPAYLFPLPSTANPDLRSPLLAARRLRATMENNPQKPVKSALMAIDPSQNLLVMPCNEHEIKRMVVAYLDRTVTTPLLNRYEIGLLTMDTNEPHPLAAKRRLSLPFEPPLWQLPTNHRATSYDAGLRIMAMAMLVHYGPKHGGLGEGIPPSSGPWVPAIYMFNWKTGKLFGRLIGHLTKAPIEAFELLTPRTVFVVNPDYNGRHDVPITFNIWTFPASEDTNDELWPHPGVLIAELGLPFTPQPCTGIWVTRQRTGAATRVTGGAPFVPDPERGVIRISIWVRNQYHIYVLRETLLELARAGEERIAGGFREPLDLEVLKARSKAIYYGDPPPSSGCAVPGCDCHGAVGGFRLALPADAERFEASDELGRTYEANDANLIARKYQWASWGPQAACMVETDEGQPAGYGRILSKKAVSLYRDVLVQQDRVNGGMFIEIRDFSPASVARASRSDSGHLPEDVTCTVSTSRTIKANRDWKADVVTHLPYVRTRRKLHDFPFDTPQECLFEVMSDDQRILIGLMSPNRGADGAGFTVYNHDFFVLCM